MTEFSHLYHRACVNGKKANVNMTKLYIRTGTEGSLLKLSCVVFNM